MLLPPLPPPPSLQRTHGDRDVGVHVSLSLTCNRSESSQFHRDVELVSHISMCLKRLRTEKIFLSKT